MAAVNQNCVFKAVTLTNGETFVLPPGAVLLGATDSSLVTSSCLNQVIPETELKCYHIKWVLNVDPTNLFLRQPIQIGITLPTNTNAWENNDGDAPTITVDKVSIGGITISAGVDSTDFGAIESAIEGSSAGSALLDRKYKFSTFRGGHTTLNFPNGIDDDGYNIHEFFFKTLDTIAPSVYFEFGGGPNIASLTRVYPVEIDCADYPTTSDISC